MILRFFKQNTKQSYIKFTFFSTFGSKNRCRTKC